jgi:cyanate permease
MEKSAYRVYGYRWVMLLVFMAIVALNQLLWITFAPITGNATIFYNVTDLDIGLLSMVFMIVYIVVSIPASWVIDTYGIRTAVGIGAALTGGFGLLRGLFAPSYALVFAAQIGIAVGQPFILNAVTTVAARWFPARERATAAGLGSLAMYLGIFAGLTLTPYLTVHSGIADTLVVYGIAGLAAAVLFFALARERPPSPPCPPGQDERSLVLDGMKQIFRIGNFLVLLLVFFIGLGIFNAVTTWIEDILRPRGFSILEAGNVGGLMIIGGIAGALIVPSLSDHFRKRVPFLILAVLGAVLGLIGVTYAAQYGLLLLSAFIFGFFLLSAGPLGFQYAAEITHPIPEGTSNGLLLLMGQISGIIFIFGMDGLKSGETGSMTLPLVILIAGLAVCVVLCLRLKEPKALAGESASR